MPPLRVMFLATFFPKPQNPGMGSWALAQARALARNGVDVKVISLTPWLPSVLGQIRRFKSWAECPAEFEWGNLHVEYPRWALYQFPRLRHIDFKRPALQHAIAWHSVARRLKRRVREFKPDIIYAHHAWISGDVARRLKRIFNIPVVITDHDFGELTECEFLPARRKFVSRVFAAADRAAPVAGRMAADIQRLFPGVRTMVAHNGTEPIPDDVVSKPRPAELAQKKIIFTAAAFYQRKGIPLLIRAFARIAHQRPSAILRIAGGGDEQSLIETTIRECGMSDRVTLIGTLPKPQVMQELVWCDVFALVGWNEPFATVYLEAFSAGRPVICCNDGGINDVFVDNVQGLAVPPHDEEAVANAIDRLLSEDQTRHRMGINAKALFDSTLTNDKRAQAMIQLFREVVSEHAGRTIENKSIRQP